MGLFTRKITVNKAINKFRTSENAYLIDCREKAEYKNGHISGSINCPIDKITEENILRRFPDKTSLFLLWAVIPKGRERLSKNSRSWDTKTRSSVDIWKSTMAL